MSAEMTICLTMVAVLAASIVQIQARILIAVDPGHGGYKSGSIGFDGKTLEKDVCLQTSKKLAAALNSMGYAAKLTRSRDAHVSLSGRTRLANRWGAKLFVSVHFNAAKNTGAHGVEVLYYRMGKALASVTVNELAEATGARNRGPKHRRDLYVLKKTNMPAILVEGGFLTNAAELQKVKDPEYQEKIALGVAKGIRKYLNHK